MWLFGDSFDHYTDLTTKYNSVSVSGAVIMAGTGRFGSHALRITAGGASVLKGVAPGSATAGALLTMAQQFAPGASPGNVGCANLWDGVTGRGHVVFARNVDGSISAWRHSGNELPLQIGAGGMVLLGTTAPGLLHPSRYESVELYVKVHASAGSVRVRINGQEVLTLTGVGTKNPTAGTTWSGWYVGQDQTRGTLDVDDLMLYDDFASGDGVTDFLGDLTAECLVVTGVGASSQWTRNTGATNVSCVDETPPDGDTTYVEDSTVGHVDTYTLPPLSRITDGIRAVQVVLTAKKTGAGTRAIAGVLRRSGTNHLGADAYLGTAYDARTAVFTTDPVGGAWTPAALASSEIGQQVTV
jgi:hypothetical protein